MVLTGARTNDANLLKQDGNLGLFFLWSGCSSSFLLLSLILPHGLSSRLSVISPLSYLLPLMNWSFTVCREQLGALGFTSQRLCPEGTSARSCSQGTKQTLWMGWTVKPPSQMSPPPTHHHHHPTVKIWANLLEQTLRRPKSWLKVTCSLYLGGVGSSCLLRLFVWLTNQSVCQTGEISEPQWVGDSTCILFSLLPTTWMNC